MNKKEKDNLKKSYKFMRIEVEMSSTLMAIKRELKEINGALRRVRSANPPIWAWLIPLLISVAALIIALI